MASAHDRSRRRAIDVARGAGSATGVLVALAVALGIPLVWVWIASQVAGTKRDLTPSLAILITTGILVSYWVALVVGSWLRGRSVSAEEERARRRRMSWNRSFRDEARRPGEEDSDPIERVFVVVAIISLILFEVWFFFFAGDPLPSQPAF
jgi:hypothetical protein